jgi:xylulokinase
MDEILHAGGYDEEQAQIPESLLGHNHVYFLPYFSGERSPHNDPFARAAFVGMTMDTKRSDMTQAVLEGVAFAVRDSLEAARSIGINVESATLCGGGAKSPLWRKIMANVLGISIVIPSVEEGPSMGAALLAMVACGEFADVRTAATANFKVSEVIEPDDELASLYNERYEAFRMLYPALKTSFIKLL